MYSQYQPSIKEELKKITQEMTEVMSLSEKQSKQLYKLHLDKIEKNQALRAENEGDKEAIKKALDKVNSENLSYQIVDVSSSDIFSCSSMYLWQKEVEWAVCLCLP